MLPITPLSRQDLGRKGLSFILHLTPCCTSVPYFSAYLRLSHEDKRRARITLDNQFDISLEAAHRAGGCLSTVYVDDDLTAAKPDVTRPAFEVLLVKLSERATLGVVQQHQDRLYRLNWDFARLQRIHNVTHRFRMITGQREYDFSKVEDTQLLQFGTIMATAEVNNVSRRVKDMHLGRARAGRRTGGPRAFGWAASIEACFDLALVMDRIRTASPEAFNSLCQSAEMRPVHELAEANPQLNLMSLIDQYEAAYSTFRREYQELICPIESEFLHEARRRIVKGTSPHTVLREWNQAGIRGTRGGHWRLTMFLQMITSPRLAGYRCYQDAVMVDANGDWVRGVQEPIFTPEEHLELVAALKLEGKRERRRYEEKSPGEQKAKRKRNLGTSHGNRKHVLSTFLICSGCNGPMYGASTAKSKTSTSHRQYTCDSRGQCPAPVTITARYAEYYVCGIVARYAARQPIEMEIVESLENTPWEKQPELDRLIQLRDVYAAEMRDPTADFEHLMQQNHGIKEDIKRLREERVQWVKSQLASTRPAEFDLPQVLSLIEGALEEPSEQDQVRGLLDRYLLGVRVKAGRRGKFDVDRLEPLWRLQESPASAAASLV